MFNCLNRLLAQNANPSQDKKVPERLCWFLPKCTAKNGLLYSVQKMKNMCDLQIPFSINATFEGVWVASRCMNVNLIVFIIHPY